MAPPTVRMPVYFLSHGGGPWPWLDGPMRDNHAQLEESLRDLPGELPAPPKAILMISAHWETRGFTVQSNPAPPMIYDFGGFPDHTYRIQYPAPGSPALAARVVELLAGAGIGIQQDRQRGFDHGMYAPLAPAWPDADVPVVQLSIDRSYDPAAHLALGRALAPLRDEGILILGSGATYHNLRLIGPEARVPSRQFDDWLGDTLLHRNAEERAVRLRQWETAPGARIAQPREDHLIPLLVAAGAGGDDPAAHTYHQHDVFGFFSSASFRFATPARPTSDDRLQGAAHA